MNTVLAIDPGYRQSAYVRQMTQPGQRLSTQQWHTSLDLETSARLLESATRRGLTRAEVLRQAVVWYLITQDRAVAWQQQQGKNGEER